MIALTDICENYSFVYSIYDRKNKKFCDSNNKQFIIDNIKNVGEYSNEKYSFGTENDVVEWLNTIFDGTLHFRAMLFGKNQHYSENNPNPNHMQKELNKLCDEEHSFWLNRGYVYDSSLIYDDCAVINTFYNNLDIIPDYNLRQRLKDEIEALSIKRDKCEDEVEQLCNEIKDNKSVISKQLYGIEQNDTKLKTQKEEFDNIIERYKKGINHVHGLQEEINLLSDTKKSLEEKNQEYVKLLETNNNLKNENIELTEHNKQLEYIKNHFKLLFRDFLKELKTESIEWCKKQKEINKYLEAAEKFEGTVKTYKLNGIKLPKFEIDYSGITNEKALEIIQKYEIEIR